MRQNAHGYWVFDHKSPGKRRNPVSTRTRDRTEAERFRRLFLDDQAELTLRDQVAARGTTVAELIDAYVALHVEHQDIRDATRWSLKPIRELLGELQPEDLTPPTIVEYRVARGRADGTLRRELGALTAALNWCKRARMLVGREWPEIALPPPSPVREVYIDDSDQPRFLAAAEAYSPRVGLFCALAIWTAARRRSIEELDWSRVDWRADVIDFRSDGRVTAKRRVRSPIANRLRPVLEAAWIAQGRPQKGLVFWPGQTRAGSLRATLEGFFAASEWSEVTPHDLRRSAAIRMARAGVPMHEIAAVLGDSLSIVMSRYLPFAPEHLRNAVNASRIESVDSGERAPNRLAKL